MPNKLITLCVGCSTSKADAINARFLGWQQAAAEEGIDVKVIDLNIGMLQEIGVTNFVQRGFIAVAASFVMFFKALTIPPQSLTIISTPPFFAAFATSLALRIRKCSYVVDVRDPYPRMFIDAGLFQENSLLGRAMQWMERRIYLGATFLTSTDYFDQLQEFSEHLDKYFLVMNGAVSDRSDFTTEKSVTETLPSSELAKVSPVHAISVIHLGRIGEMQDQAMLCEELEVFLASNRVEKILFVGDRFQALKDSKITNIGYVPPSEVANIIATCQIGLNYKKRTQGGELNVPIRVFEYLNQGLIVRSNYTYGISRFIQDNGLDANFSLVSSDRPEDGIEKALQGSRSITAGRFFRKNNMQRFLSDPRVIRLFNTIALRH